MTAEPRYPEEILDGEEDDGTMPDNVAELEQAVIGHRIVSVEWHDVPTKYGREQGATITLDNGRTVTLVNTSDCCAYTELHSFLLHPDKVDHMILGVGTTGNYETWHIYADWGDVLELSVGWSCGNPFYYGYGFDIIVRDGGPVR